MTSEQRYATGNIKNIPLRRLAAPCPTLEVDLGWVLGLSERRGM